MDVVIGSGFDWDDGNRQKCQKHGVSIEEIESVFANDPVVYRDEIHSRDEERWQAIGRTLRGRAVFVVFTIRQVHEGWRIRPVSARFMHVREVENYGRTHET